jgi:hypothetical protein
VDGGDVAMVERDAARAADAPRVHAHRTLGQDVAVRVVVRLERDHPSELIKRRRVDADVRCVLYTGPHTTAIAW